MNFLSHLFLSGNNEGLIIGNFIADSVKGSAHNQYPAEIQKGILLHRSIDTFTDTHPVVELSKQRLRPSYRKYASVIVDIFYDHYLAANFKLYASEPLHDYVKRIYRIIEKNKEHFPLKSAHFTHYMLRYNILEAYSRLDGIEKVLNGMAGRARFESHMEQSIHDLKRYYNLFEEEFHLFFPELQKHVNNQIILL